MSYLQITASDLSDQLLKDFLDIVSSQIVTMHIQSVDQNKAIKSIKHTITELDRSKIEEQKKAVRSGYDMERSWIVPRLRTRRKLSVPETIWISFRQIWQITARTQRHC